MQKTPIVSVLVPTYNYARYLDEAIQSVLNQTFKDFELIIVDDQSTDNTDEIIEKYLEDPRISYYKNPKNLGLVANFNRCMEYSKGEYLKFLLADDKLHPTLLEKFVAIMNAYPSVSLVTCGSSIFGSVSQTRELPMVGFQRGRDVIMLCLQNGKGNWIGEPTVVMFRKQDSEVVKFNPEYICMVDLDMWLRLLTRGDCYIIPETLAYFRRHSEQASDKNKIKNWFDEYYFYKNIKRNNCYNVKIEELDIDEVIKRKAKKCVKRILKIVPQFYKKGNLPLILEGIRIGRVEKVFK
jgi:glycosyltransferase involved in cell wall biosynthesis